MTEKPLETPLLPNEDDCNHLTDPPSYGEGVSRETHQSSVYPPFNHHPQQISGMTSQAAPLNGLPSGTLQSHQQVHANIPLANMPSSNVSVVMPVFQVLPVGPEGMRMRCYHCGADIKTSTTKSNKSSAHIACWILCVTTCCLFWWIPYCMGSCKKVDHKCPNCNEYLGTYNA